VWTSGRGGCPCCLSSWRGAFVVPLWLVEVSRRVVGTRKNPPSVFLRTGSKWRWWVRRVQRRRALRLLLPPGRGRRAAARTRRPPSSSDRHISVLLVRYSALGRRCAAPGVLHG